MLSKCLLCFAHSQFNCLAELSFSESLFAFKTSVSFVFFSSVGLKACAVEIIIELEDVPADGPGKLLGTLPTSFTVLAGIFGCSDAPLHSGQPSFEETSDSPRRGGVGRKHGEGLPSPSSEGLQSLAGLGPGPKKTLLV